MSRLDHRVLSLETALLPQGEPTVIIVRFDAPVTTLRHLDGAQAWGRLHDEDEATFVRRASREARDGAGVVVLISE